MTILEFMTGSPFLTAFIIFAISATIIETAQAIRGKVDDDNI